MTTDADWPDAGRDGAPTRSFEGSSPSGGHTVPLSSLPEPHRRIVAALLAAKKAADTLREQEKAA